MAAAEALDALGTLYCTVRSLDTQQRETRAKLEAAEWGQEGIKNVVGKIKVALQEEENRLDTACERLVSWGLDVAPFASKLPAKPNEMAALCETLPLASTDPDLPKPIEPLELTVQRLLGFCVFSNKVCGTALRNCPVFDRIASCGDLFCCILIVSVSRCSWGMRMLQLRCTTSDGLRPPPRSLVPSSKTFECTGMP